MDSSSDHLLIFFLLFSYHNLNGLAMATSDESLISTLCSKTEEPRGTQPFCDTFKLLQNAMGESKRILHDCTQHSLLAQKQFPPVAHYVQEGHYDSAIKASVIYCLKLFEQTPELPVPQQVLAGTVASNQTCRNAVEILSSI
ncbi:uncharacterized protein LOC114749078 [Neltuma alba]|uniref:uncharacterized protein LOC114749078 n=1 Tax=Neltuma alba TaxID=207710 RepID=UPI0010A49D8D|nr:uncharacterized protein LOC114749078 [Prosopis alba]